METATSNKASVPEKNPERLKVLAKIDQLERECRWTEDPEDDPPTRPLKPGECDYLRKKLSSKILKHITFKRGLKLIDQLMAANQFILKPAVGDEKLNDFLGKGAIVTCNHFNAYDSFCLEKVYDKYLEGDFIYRVIREGNFTSMKGSPFEPLFKYCNTLPLASSFTVMKEFMSAIKILLSKGKKIIVYAEQGMWWNYRKPRPLTPGAFKFAAENNVPVIPNFITMKDSQYTDADGFPVQEHTVHVLEPIYPDPTKSVKENMKIMAENNYQQWKKCYEEVYGIPLTYLAGEGSAN